MGNKTIGSWITLGNYSIAEVMAQAGFDWLCVDIEHTAIPVSEMQLLIAAIQANGVVAYVRVGANDELIIKRALDAGADGIIVPMINSKEEAQKAVNACFYPPIGKRGVGLARAQGYSFGFENYKNNKAKNIELIVQIEHIDAINNLEEILSVSGVSGSFIGPYDLSGSLGNPGVFDTPEMQKALTKYEQIAGSKNKKMGVHVVNPNGDLVTEKISLGYNFIAFSLDTFFLGQKIRDELQKIKK
ncbi:MAG: 2,4-dihydroxyhept-2-ene-1,7-dioic acid aldolase [Flavobacteriales bacterium]|nr:2,4-dihydroxyhept-2-ene-1,7-dioic acid aldolase [Flavobacteriales bacterium]